MYSFGQNSTENLKKEQAYFKEIKKKFFQYYGF